jgi:hypothetical protein
MKAVPGLLVEYLINGLLVVLWVLPLIPVTIAEEKNYLIFLPLVYIAGMAVDVIAYLLTFFPKIYIRETVEPQNSKDRPSGTRRRAYILHNSAELGEELEKRSSRDRIARGVVVNLIPIVLVYEVSLFPAGVAFVFACGTWAWFERQSYQFEHYAASILNYVKE